MAETDISATTVTTPVQSAALDEAVRRLVDALHPERIYLFGSRARGDAQADSDWDLMVVVSACDETGHDLAVATRRAVGAIGIPMDLLVWTADRFDWQTPAVASLPATILREGQVLYAA